LRLRRIGGDPAGASRHRRPGRSADRRQPALGSGSPPPPTRRARNRRAHPGCPVLSGCGGRRGGHPSPPRGAARPSPPACQRDLARETLRTRRRPRPHGRMAPSHALLFGIVLGLAAFVLLAFWVNVLAATLAISGLLFYVFVYTLWLKRSTVQNIVIGGAAGA